MIRVSNLFHIVYKGNPKVRFEETLEVHLGDLKGIVPSSFKVTIETIPISLDPVDLKLL